MLHDNGQYSPRIIKVSFHERPQSLRTIRVQSAPTNDPIIRSKTANFQSKTHLNKTKNKSLMTPEIQRVHSSKVADYQSSIHQSSIRLVEKNDPIDNVAKEDSKKRFRKRCCFAYTWQCLCFCTLCSVLTALLIGSIVATAVILTRNVTTTTSTTSTTSTTTTSTTSTTTTSTTSTTTTSTSTTTTTTSTTTTTKTTTTTSKTTTTTTRTTTTTFYQCATFTVKLNWDFSSSNDLAIIRNVTFSTCCNACISTSGCVAFILNVNNNCILKNTATGGFTASISCITGYL